VLYALWFMAQQIFIQMQQMVCFTSNLHIESALSVICPMFYGAANLYSNATDGLLHIESAH
jgi:hypothetical protein